HSPIPLWVSGYRPKPISPFPYKGKGEITEGVGVDDFINSAVLR
ncbi:hypothetical protein SAMN05216241_1041, partial [Limimonas halophila]